jgi:transcriptional regulator of NAD metabolism
MTHVTPGTSTCQPVVRAHLAEVVGEVTRTIGVQDFGTLKGLGCSTVEKRKGTKARATWQTYRTLEV